MHLGAGLLQLPRFLLLAPRGQRLPSDEQRTRGKVTRLQLTALGYIGVWRPWRAQVKRSGDSRQTTYPRYFTTGVSSSPEPEFPRNWVYWKLTFRGHRASSKTRPADVSRVLRSRDER